MAADTLFEPAIMSSARSDAPSILRTEKLVKIYGGRAVVNGVDIELKRGEIVGLL